MPQPYPVLAVGDMVDVMELETDAVIVRARGEIWRTRVSPSPDNPPEVRPLNSGDRLTVMSADILYADLERIPEQGGGRYRVAWRQHLAEWGPSRT